MEARLVRDIYPGSEGSSVSKTASDDGVLYFNAFDGQDYGLWRSDGTSSGTTLIQTLERAPLSVDEYVAVGENLFFVNFDNETGRELWFSDGTDEGTVVRDIFDSGSSNPSQLTKVGDEIYFLANSDGDGANELWVSDGTEDGTQLVLENRVSDLTNFGGTLYYTEISSPGELWRINSTSREAERVLESGSSTITNLTPVEDTLYFTRNSNELWKVEDNSDTPELVNEFTGGINDLTGVGDTLYFTHGNGKIGKELYKSNGEESNTGLVKDISPERIIEGETVNPSSDLNQLTDVNGTLYFVADSDNDGRPELWISEGTEANTKLITEFDSGFINHLIDVNGIVYFNLDSEVWRSDGTEEGTILSTDILSGDLSRAEVVNGDLYYPSSQGFLDDNAPGEELWILDNTSEVTRLFDPDTRANVYTTDEEEIEDLIDSSYENRGVAFNSADPLSGQPVYTFVNEDNGARIYTIDEGERDRIKDTMSGFEETDETFYAYETRRTDTVPVYSFQNIATEGEFLTTSLATKESFDDNDDFESNGVAFYAFPEIDLA